jgi:hypothetical protein
MYGYHFEVKASIVEDPNILLYGCHISDCLAIVYVESAKGTVTYLSNCIKFDNCTITWSAVKSQPFLDMFLFINEDNRLEHKLFQKAQNHRERIP